MSQITRRGFLAGAVSVAGVIPIVSLAQNAPAVHVLKDPNCGCCEAWVRIMSAEGFDVTTENSFGTLLMQHKMQAGGGVDELEHAARLLLE